MTNQTDNSGSGRRVLKNAWAEKTEKVSDTM